MMNQGLGPAPEQKREDPKAPEGKDAPGAEMLPTPELKAVYNQVYGATLSMLYSEKFMPKAEQAIQNAPTPEAGVSQIAAAIGAKVYKTAMQKGDDIPDEVMLLGGWRVVQEVADFARTDAGVEINDEQIETAFYMASEELRGMLGEDHNIGSSANPEDQAKMLEMAGGEEGMNTRKQKMAQALIKKKQEANQ